MHSNEQTQQNEGVNQYLLNSGGDQSVTDAIIEYINQNREHYDAATLLNNIQQIVSTQKTQPQQSLYSQEKHQEQGVHQQERENEQKSGKQRRHNQQDRKTSSTTKNNKSENSQESSEKKKKKESKHKNTTTTTYGNDTIKTNMNLFLKPARKTTKYFISYIPSKLFCSPYKYDLLLRIPKEMNQKYDMVFHLLDGETNESVNKNIKGEKAFTVEKTKTNRRSYQRVGYANVSFRLNFSICSFHNFRRPFYLKIMRRPKELTEKNDSSRDEMIFCSAPFQIYARKSGKGGGSGSSGDTSEWGQTSHSKSQHHRKHNNNSEETATQVESGFQQQTSDQFDKAGIKRKHSHVHDTTYSDIPHKQAKTENSENTANPNAKITINMNEQPQQQLRMPTSQQNQQLFQQEPLQQQTNTTNQQNVPTQQSVHNLLLQNLQTIPDYNNPNQVQTLLMNPNNNSYFMPVSTNLNDPNQNMLWQNLCQQQSNHQYEDLFFCTEGNDNDNTNNQQIDKSLQDKKELKPEEKDNPYQIPTVPVLQQISNPSVLQNVQQQLLQYIGNNNHDANHDYNTYPQQEIQNSASLSNNAATIPAPFDNYQNNNQDNLTQQQSNASQQYPAMQFQPTSSLLFQHPQDNNRYDISRLFRRNSTNSDTNGGEVTPGSFIDDPVFSGYFDYSSYYF